MITDLWASLLPRDGVLTGKQGRLRAADSARTPSDNLRSGSLLQPIVSDRRIDQTRHPASINRQAKTRSAIPLYFTYSSMIGCKWRGCVPTTTCRVAQCKGTTRLLADKTLEQTIGFGSNLPRRRLAVHLIASLSHSSPSPPHPSSSYSRIFDQHNFQLQLFLQPLFIQPFRHSSSNSNLYSSASQSPIPIHSQPPALSVTRLSSQS